MRIVTNEALVERNKKFATRLFFFSLGILILGFFAANGQLLGISALENLDETVYLLVMPIVLMLGFISTMVSVRMTNLWIRQPRPEAVIPEGLKGLSNKSTLYNYYHDPVRHVLVTPQGVFVMVTRFQDGKFAVDKDRWRAFKGPVGNLFSLFRLDGVGNPTQEAQEAAKVIRYIVEDYDTEMEVQPLIVFVDPRAELEIGEVSVPVLHADPKKHPNLKDYLKEHRQKNGDYFTNEEITEFLKEFEDATL